MKSDAFPTITALTILLPSAVRFQPRPPPTTGTARSSSTRRSPSTGRRAESAAAGPITRPAATTGTAAAPTVSGRAAAAVGEEGGTTPRRRTTAGRPRPSTTSTARGSRRRCGELKCKLEETRDFVTRQFMNMMPPIYTNNQGILFVRHCLRTCRNRAWQVLTTFLSM